MSENERKAAFFLAVAARSRLEAGPSDEAEAEYLTDEVRAAVHVRTKALFLESGWDEDALRREVARSRIALVGDTEPAACAAEEA